VDNIRTFLHDHPQAVEEFKNIYQQECKDDLSNDEIFERAVEIFRILLIIRKK